jgi:UDP-3-O-[3-hydroxymyristoyl] glucosamine N-acyltransferase
MLRELAARLGCELRGDGDVEVRRMAAIEEAAAGDLSFLSNPRYVKYLATTRASAVIVSPETNTTLPSLVSQNPYLTYAHAAAILSPAPVPAPGVHASAQVEASAQLGQAVHVGAMAYVGARVRIGARSIVHAHVVVYEDVEIGEDCVIHSGVQVRERCRIGDRVVIQNAAVIGADGFGFARDENGRYRKIPQTGIVVIEDDVEIGALAAIDRAALHETRVGRGTKIDNLVQVGHSVKIGSDSAFAGQVGIAGSAKVGDRVILAGQVGVVGHIEIGDGAIVMGQSGLHADVEPGAVVAGSPAFDSRRWMKATAVFAKLPELQKRVRELEREVGRLRRGAPTAGSD